jgi:hypothetical protein
VKVVVLLVQVLLLKLLNNSLCAYHTLLCVIHQ